MSIIDLIEKKVNKNSLTQEEYDFVVQNFISGEIKDYQMSSFLMAIKLQGMSDQELFYWTNSFINSGEILDLSAIEGIKIDKHSTGGVGDKISLILCPILAAMGYKIPKMSGRGLGHTGGTIDKLESIPGLNTDLSISQFINQTKQIGYSAISQSGSLVPADKKIYALRDVTGTVNSIPLIASSIMSKKIAVGADVILIDVKCGNGAFMTNLRDAKLLAQKLISIGERFGKQTIVEITNMSVPLGKMIGNKNEVLEAIDVLSGKGSTSLTKFIYKLVENFLVNVIKKSPSVARREIKDVIESKKALNKFFAMVKSQGGNVDLIQADSFWKPKYSYDVKSEKSGYIKWESALAFGKISLLLGAGRLKKEDTIDNEAGIELKVENGDYVGTNQTLFTLYSSKPIDWRSMKNLIEQAYTILEKQHQTKMFLTRMTNEF
ncbi:thymidine phosphorylase [Mesomycoplasma conjunctivae]|uniref:thymidine phosphorylase n=1 Tax=Mesomycoplasma conjunctivae TaxID=45361 RepID=UPI003DA4D689